ncbi:hypothetical protein ACGFYU_09295 [Streptomyces sp. NPDC048337]|uniref:hypothetical protein n=1 Tax=Streptomyces sp. NPDC048337 TaxID=3365535 RepID=UPI003722C634
MKIKNIIAAGALALAAVSAAAPMASAATTDDTPGLTDAVALTEPVDMPSIDALTNSPLTTDKTWGAEESPDVMSDLTGFTDSLSETAHHAVEGAA